MQQCVRFGVESGHYRIDLLRLRALTEPRYVDQKVRGTSIIEMCEESVVVILRFFTG